MLIFFGIVVDTSCILAWLIEEGYEVYAFMADVGQEEVLKRVFTGARTTDTFFRITMLLGRRLSALVPKSFSSRFV